MKQIWKFLLLLLFAFSWAKPLYAQKQGLSLIDSLLKELPMQKDDTDKVNILEGIAFEFYRFSMPDSGIIYGEKQASLASKIKWARGIASANNVLGACNLSKNEKNKSLVYFQAALKIYDQIGRKDKVAVTAFNMGNVYFSIPDFALALECYFKALKIFESSNSFEMIAACNSAIGNIYVAIKDYSTAVEYHLRAVQIADTCREVDKFQKAEVYSNIGICFQYQGDCANSLLYDVKALNIASEIGIMSMAANMNGNISLAYSKLKEYPKAVYYGHKSFAISDSIHDKFFSAWALYEIGHAYLSFITDTATKKQNLRMDSLLPASRPAQIQLTIQYFRRSLDSIHHSQREAELAVKIYEDLVIAYRLTGDCEKTLQANDIFMALKDSLFSQETDRKLLAQRMKYDFNKREVEAKAEQNKKDIRQRNIRNSILAGLAVMLIFSGLLFRQHKKVKKEKARSEELLLNILPGEVAEELKANGTTRAKHYNNVTVLFTDFVNFTTTSERMGAQTLIDELHVCFKAFDEITAKFGIEKIKTIGDAYLAVAGLPTADANHAENMVKAANEIRNFMAERYAKYGDKTFQVRVGVHSGSVVAGIVGIKKFAYDIWGDTVNTAARMEQNSLPGKINISETTYELVKDKFNCEFRGEIEAKGKGMMKMYFVG